MAAAGGGGGGVSIERITVTWLTRESQINLNIQQQQQPQLLRDFFMSIFLENSDWPLNKSQKESAHRLHKT